jgi:hypothetical protein
LALFINKQGKCNAGLLPEEFGVVPVTQADGRDADSSAVEFCLAFTQLRDMFAAEDSSIVPQKSHDCWLFCPDRSEHDLIVVGIGQADACQPCA